MNAEILFVGNRRFVLQEILASGARLASVCVIAGTHLERDLKNGQPGMEPWLDRVRLIHSRQELLDIIAAGGFDVLVSNGCPYILPIESLPQATYANIHPSCLPDLRGYDPVIGAVLHERDAGATCHLMDAGIDTGAIISQIRIPFTADLDVTTLYQLSFLAERDAFREALARDFVPERRQPDMPGAIAYRRCPEDMAISFDEPAGLMIRKIRAFNNLSIGCRFVVNGCAYRVFDGEIMINPYLLAKVLEAPEGVIVFSYENCIIFHKGGQVVRFTHIMAETVYDLKPGDRLF